MIQSTLHIDLGQLGKPTDTGPFEHDLRHGSRAIGRHGKFFHRLLVEIDTDFIISNSTLIEKSFDFHANGACFRTVNLDCI